MAEIKNPNDPFILDVLLRALAVLSACADAMGCTDGTNAPHQVPAGGAGSTSFLPAIKVLTGRS